MYDRVQKYCMFVGYPRSGHSLVGSLLDAHPNALIAHELDALGFLSRGYGRNRLFYLIERNSLEFGRVGRSWTGYQYDVEGQWQGSFDKDLLVIGDKKGGMSSRRLQDDPELISRLREVIQIPVNFIHVVRNPFDNISTIANRNKTTLEEAADFYFSLCETNQRMKEETEAAFFLEFKLEELIENPRSIISQMCQFMGIEPNSDYLTACEAVLFERPKKTRDSMNWSTRLVDKVMEQISRYDFLTGYAYGE
jgi:hypothetical protein